MFNLRLIFFLKSSGSHCCLHRQFIHPLTPLVGFDIRDAPAKGEGPGCVSRSLRNISRIEDRSALEEFTVSFVLRLRLENTSRRSGVLLDCASFGRGLSFDARG